ncbi:MAG: ATP-binding protein [Gemmatimonadaceae bacterium]
MPSPVGGVSESRLQEDVVLSWSGGKDSSLALAELRGDPRYHIVALLTSITRGYDRVSIHGVRRELVEAQAAAAGLPLFEVTIDPQSSNEDYETAFRTALARVRKGYPSVKKIAFGDLFLQDVREYRERLVSVSGMGALFPLWGRDTLQLAEEFISAGFCANIVCVDTTQLSADFAGEMFDMKFLEALPGSVDPCGERGEFHSFVSSGPVFATPIRVRRGELVLREERFMFCDLLAVD